ncbi:MAG: PAS domain S-box protein [Candidatus Brocadiales bacterium]|nr:PAS domain S-box protein [Candidatus Brocadiales bacterium]
MQFIRKNQILISTIAAISVFCIVLFTRSIQSRIVHGKQGQIAIKTLDEVRRPFLSIHSAETALLKDGYRKTFRDDLEQGIVLGLRLISDFRVVAAYNPELLQRVEKLANTFDTWIKIERTFFNQSAWTASADIKPLSNVEKLDSITETAGCFSLTMDALGNVEIPIHRDIREGSRAVNEVVITGGGVIVLLISMLFLMMYYKNKTLRMMIIGRKNTENTLKQSERQLRTITENIPGIIWMSDPEISVINYISPGYKNIFGRTCESLYENPMSFLEAVHNDDREYILNALKKYEQGDYNVEYRIVKPDGSIRWIWAQSFPLRDEKGMIYSITGVAQDISERKQVEETISHLSKAVEQSPSIFMITDYNGNISFVNPRFTQLTGYTEEETIGQNPRFLQSGKTAFEEYKRLWEVISAGGTWKGEFHNKKKNGELYWESASISSMKNKDGVITHFIKAAEDITRRKQSEQKIIMLNETLEQRVKERSEKLIY